MSAEHRSIQFGVIIEDADHWSEEHKREANHPDFDPMSYSDWVTAQLEAVMKEAGDAFIASKPDLFRGGMI